MTFLPLDSFSVSDSLRTSALGFVIVLCVLAFLMMFIKLMSKVISGATKSTQKDTDTSAVTHTAQPSASTVPATQTPNACETLPSYIPGYVTLDGVSEQDAAVIMAITSYKTGIGLERLAFSSIKRINRDPVLENISEQDAAAVMAITSDRTGIPLEKLCFNSIKSVEE